MISKKEFGFPSCEEKKNLNTEGEWEWYYGNHPPLNLALILPPGEREYRQPDLRRCMKTSGKSVLCEDVMIKSNTIQ